MMKRNKGIDLLRFLCCFMVVYIHNSIDSPLNPYLLVLCKVSVPIFFLITGFYHQSIIDKGNEKAELCKVFRLILFSFFLYLVFFFLLYFRSGNFVSFLMKKFEGNGFFDIVLFNVNPLLHRLWYLNALFYVLLVTYLLHRYDQMKAMYFIVPILLFIGLIMGPYSRLILHVDFPEHYTRNFVFIGIPYFYIGWLISKYYSKLKDFKTEIPLLISIILMIGEVFLLEKTGLLNNPAFALMTLPVSVLLFLFFSRVSAKSQFTNLFSEFGKRNSSDIYIIHKIAEILLGKFIPFFGNFISVFVLSLLMSVVNRAILDRFKKQKG